MKAHDESTFDGWRFVIENDCGRVALDGTEEHELFLLLQEREAPAE